ncbi:MULTISPECIES: glycosyltransferase [unclassified Vibrio]|uniref:CgeB family protein n=1 Tax=unclassified Vibrio TaxID=2614977 RepID=UPI00354D028C
MKVLIVSDGFSSHLYADSFTKPFEKLDWEVEHFEWLDYFFKYQYPNHYSNDGNKLKSIYFRVQNKFTIGPALKNINCDLIEKVKSYKPDLVLIYRGTHVWSSTIDKIKTEKSIVFSYNNDDPFSSNYPFYYWRLHKKMSKSCDLVYAYRKKNIDDYLCLGIEKVKLLRSYYVTENNFRSTEVEKDIDVLFIGHFENDGRDHSILKLLRSGVDVKLYGTGWSKSEVYEDIVKFNGLVKPVYKDYNLTINRAKIALVFLSKLNRDTYTRRCFEIPATGTLMLSEHTDDLATMFEPNLEACFFNSDIELIEKVKNLLSDSRKLDRIASAGYARLINDGHEVNDRVKDIIDDYIELKAQGSRE